MGEHVNPPDGGRRGGGRPGGDRSAAAGRHAGGGSGAGTPAPAPEAPAPEAAAPGSGPPGRIPPGTPAALAVDRAAVDPGGAAAGIAPSVRPAGPPPRVAGTAALTAVRAADPGAIGRALRARARFDPAGFARPLFVLAADHPARGAVAAGGDPVAMGDRHELLARCTEALSRPGVDGFLGTADLVEDLALLGALEGKLVLGSMNRGGLPGASFEVDDRFTGYDARGIAESGLDGGKMLLRVDPADPGTARALESCARAVDELAERDLLALIEPFASRRDGGRLRNVLTADAQIHVNGIAQGLGRTSARTWLKVPVVPDMERMMASTTLPTLLLGGEGGRDPDALYAGWRDALKIPQVRGLIVGRTMLFPPDGDVAGAVDAAVALLGR